MDFSSSSKNERQRGLAQVQVTPGAATCSCDDGCGCNSKDGVFEVEGSIEEARQKVQSKVQSLTETIEKAEKEAEEGRRSLSKQQKALLDQALAFLSKAQRHLNNDSIPEAQIVNAKEDVADAEKRVTQVVGEEKGIFQAGSDKAKEIARDVKESWKTVLDDPKGGDVGDYARVGISGYVGAKVISAIF